MLNKEKTENAKKTASYNEQTYNNTYIENYNVHWN